MTRNPIHRSGLLLLAMLTPLAPLSAEDESPRELLRDALYAEEVTRDPAKAAEHYQKVLELYEEERPFAATALFRLAEVRRKQGNKEEAAKLYQRLLRDFPTAEVEGKLARENLVAMGGAVPEAGAPGEDDAESKELRRLQELKRTSPDLARDPNLLSSAASAGQMRTMAFLIESGIDPNSGPFLSSAAGSGNLKAVEFLLAKGCDPGKPPNDVAINEAVKNGFHTIAEALLKAGGKATYVYRFAESSDGGQATFMSMLHLAAKAGDERMCKILLDHGADPNFMPEFCYPTSVGLNKKPAPVGSALHQAIYDGETGDGILPALLLKAGAKAGLAAPGTGLTPLHFAAQRGSPAVVQLLLDAGAPVDARTAGPKFQDSEHVAEVTPLLYAAERGSPETIRLLLSKGADANAEDKNGASALSYALASKKPEVLDLLIRAGAKVTSPELIASAIDRGSKEVVARLLDAGADPNAYSPNYRKPPLEIAAERNSSTEILRMLLDHAAKPGEEWLNSSFRNSTDENRKVLTEKFVYPDLMAKPAVTLVYPDAMTRNEAAVRDGDAAPASLEELLLKATKIPHFRRGQTGQVTGSDGFPALVTIVRTNATGGTDRIAARIDGSAALPKLQWGDIVELAVDWQDSDANVYRNRNVEYRDQVFPKIAWLLRKQVTVPITVSFGDAALAMTLRGDRLVYHPGENVAPLLPAGPLAGLLWNGYVPKSLVVRRGGWPEIRINIDTPEWRRFEFQAGDHVLPEYPAEYASKQAEWLTKRISLSVPGTGFVKSWSNAEPATAPTLVEIIADLYASWHPNDLENLPEGGSERWAEISARELDDALGRYGRGGSRFIPFPIVPEHPDFSRIRILRRDAEGKETVLDVDLAKAIAACTEATAPEEVRRQDVALQAGDRVELPLKATPQAGPWGGFTAEESRFFGKVLGGNFQLTDVAGDIRRIRLNWQQPKWTTSPGGLLPFPPDGGVPSSNTRFQSLSSPGNPGVNGLLLIRGDAEERRTETDIFIRDGDRIRTGNGLQPPIPGQPQSRPQPRAISPQPRR
ncbi:ankyrin repeat domain-containing protein [Luteolibacter sp. Populi]|uniref:ankyrin repeat domain-containing protein n=1 Tax=Luteolibacter sp. Populi TaxID=3230487 RepID=UPI003466E9E3